MTKHLARVNVARLSPQRIVMVPWAVRGTTTMSRGRPCDRCIVVTQKEWRERGMELLCDALRLAPLTADAPLKGWRTKKTTPALGVPLEAVRVFTYVTHAVGGPPMLGRIEARPRSRSYRSSEVFRFTESKDPAVFHQQMARLLGDAELDD
jgi:hypothetical protein